LQLTAFGAQDRWYFVAILCSALAATERQAVGPLHSLYLVGKSRTLVLYH